MGVLNVARWHYRRYERFFKRRFYELYLTPDLLGGFQVVRVYGSLNSDRCQKRADWFANLPRTHNRIITNCTPKGREAVIQQAIDSLSQLGSFRRFMDSNNDCWMLCDKHHKIEHINPAFREMLDIRPEADIVGGLLINLPLSAHPRYVENCVKHITLAQERGLKRWKSIPAHPRCTEEDPRCVAFEYTPLRNPKTGMNKVVVQGSLVLGDFDLKTLVKKLPIIQDESEDG